MSQRNIYYKCECGALLRFFEGYIPEKFYCTTCEKEYSAEQMFEELKAGEE